MGAFPVLGSSTLTVNCLRNANNHRLLVVTVCAVHHFDGELKARLVFIKKTLFAYYDILVLRSTGWARLETTVIRVVVKLALIDRIVIKK